MDMDDARPPDSQPYETLAGFYDFVMRHVDYGEWSDYVERVFKHHGPVPNRIVEVACGTGTVAVKLARRGYTIRGIDRSPEMIEQATAKLGGLGDSLSFEVGDMRDLPSDDADALICLYDSVNYCLAPTGLATAFAGFRRMVVDGALCVFDVTTEVNSLRYFRNFQSDERCKGFVYRRESTYLQKDRLQVNDFHVTMAGSDSEILERHEQRIYAVDELVAAVPDSWEILGMYDDYTLEPAGDESERIHFVMRALPDGAARTGE